MNTTSSSPKSRPSTRSLWVLPLALAFLSWTAPSGLDQPKGSTVSPFCKQAPQPDLDGLRQLALEVIPNCQTADLDGQAQHPMALTTLGACVCQQIMGQQLANLSGQEVIIGWPLPGWSGVTVGPDGSIIHLPLEVFEVTIDATGRITGCRLGTPSADDNQNSSP